MTYPLITTIIVLIVAAVLFLSDRLSADLIALLIVVTLGVTGVLTPQETFSGFSRSAVITIIAIFILAEGLKRAGVTEKAGEWLLRTAGQQEWRLTVITMAAGAVLSLFMNNIAAAAVLLPAVTGAAQRLNVRLSRLMMPLAFSTILGGMATLLTTTNIVASSLLRDHGLDGFSLVEFLPLGVPVVVVGIVYMTLFGRRLLPQEGTKSLPPPDVDLVDMYRLEERLYRVRITPTTPLQGIPLINSRLRENYGMSLVAIERGGEMLLYPSPEMIIQAGDVLLLEGRANYPEWDELKNTLEILPFHQPSEGELESPSVAVVEAVLAPRSTLVGQTLRSGNFRDKYGMLVLAVWRAGRPIRTGLGDLELQFGDALLLQGPRSRLDVLASEPDLIVLNGKGKSGPAVPHKRGLALAILAAALILSAARPAAVGEIMLGGALAMALTGLFTMDQAYRAVEWKSVFLVAGMLPLGTAITKTGAADLAAAGLIRLIGGTSPWILLGGLFLLAVLATQIMNGAAVSAVMIPITIQAAQALGLEPRSMVMGVTLATSMAFITPLGHPVNILVMGPGNYRFSDYLRVGLGLTVLLAAVIFVLMPIFWPLK